MSQGVLKYGGEGVGGGGIYVFLVSVQKKLLQRKVHYEISDGNQMGDHK